MATSSEREELRSTLKDRGFSRVFASQDEGDGAYLETWANGDNAIHLHWGPRTPTRPEFSAESCPRCGIVRGFRHLNDCVHAGRFVR